MKPPVKTNSDGVKEMEEVPKYTMGVATRLTGVQAGRIRRFEAAGLIQPKRTEGGQRLFTDSQIERIKEVATLENEGVNLDGVKVILAIRSGTRT